MTQPNMQWTTKANCKGTPTHLWYTHNNNKTNQQTLNQICNTCPVQQQCLTHALHWEPAGTWAATTPQQRNQLRKKHNITLKTTQPTP